MEEKILKTSRINIIRLAEIDSTNDYLKRHQKSLTSGTIAVANHQTKGRGRRGHAWTSVPGKSLLFSILAKPHGNIKPVTNLSICPAVAIVRALAALSINAAVKWPNDIIIKDRKIAGVLVENSWKYNQLESIIIGVGINVTQNQQDLENLEAAGSILTQTGKTVEKELLFELILAEFNRILDYILLKIPIHDLNYEWLAHCDHTDCPVHLFDPQGRTSGIFKGLNQNGEAVIETADKEQYVFENSKYKLRKTNAVDD